MDARTIVHDRGKLLIREYYTQEALDEMRREFVKLNLPYEEFPAYVAWCYDQEQVDPYDLHQP